jgi:hypothetical protein
MRTVEIHNDPDTPVLPRGPVAEAIGYLSAWSINTAAKSHVRIVLSADGNITAQYAPTPSAVTAKSYLMFGILDPDTNTYRFHS